jgi:Tfp pilus assembly protein PilX
MRLFKTRVDQEEGVVLITVLLVTFVLLTLVAGTMAYAIGSQPISRRDQDWNAALTAAEAGLDDYVYRLNQNDQYYLYGTTPPPASGECGAYPSLATAPDGNQAFTSWVAVPGATSNATFRYSVDTSCTATQGAIVVWATGKAANVTRTIQATVRRRSFIDYLYFTDFETTDPAQYPVSGYNSQNSTWAQTNCAQHWQDVRPGGPPYDNSHCVDINFVSGDVINGPLHSNDAILICGSPTFNGNVTTSYQGTGSPVKRYRTNSGCSGNNPTFARAGDPKYADPLTMPPSNVSIKVKADATLGGTGCLFTGPTSITLNAAGTMTVVSPYTVSGAPPNNCAGGTLAAPVTEALPTDGVIYVQNVPSTGDNSSTVCKTSTEIGGAGTVQQPLGYPQNNDDISQYGCMDGDVFLKGTLKGRLTIAADNNINIINSVTYQGGTGGSDLLGLVANNYVQIYHPVGDCGSGASPCDNGSKVNGEYNLDDTAGGLTTAFNNPVVDAAILSVNHSFQVQNYQYGDNTLGSISIYGAIAQEYRGTVGVGNTSGYLKSYSYDPRLKYQSPPFFLNPIAAAWQIVTWVECKGTSNGSVPTTCQ